MARPGTGREGKRAVLQPEHHAEEPHWLTEEAIGQVAGYFKLLSEPLRLRILQVLREGERTVQQLVDELHCSQANVSKHLRLLLDGGLVARRKEGLNAYYRLADPVIDSLCGIVCNRQQGLLESRVAAFQVPRPRT